MDIDQIMKLREHMFDLDEEIEDLQEKKTALADAISEAIDALPDDEREELQALVDQEEDEEDEEEEDQEDE